MRDLGARLAGVALVAVSVASSLLHRTILAKAAGGPPQLLEFAAGLTSFVSALVGMLLLIHGGRLFERAPDATEPAEPCPGESADYDWLREAEALDTRNGVALVLTRRAIVAAAVRRARSAPVTPVDAAGTSMTPASAQAGALAPRI